RYHAKVLQLLYVYSFNDLATTGYYSLSLHDALPICEHCGQDHGCRPREIPVRPRSRRPHDSDGVRFLGGGRKGSRRNRTPSLSRSEEHTSELQSLAYLVCRLLLEKKKKVTDILELRT